MFVLPIVLVTAACGDDDSTSGNTATDDASETTQSDVAFDDLTGQGEVVIQVRDNSFVPEHAMVSAGTTVTFDNRGRNPHNAVPVEDGAFTEVPTESLQPGQAATVVFDEPGEYPYYCTLHGTETAGMVGTIRVV
jgi:plastocyanin